MTRTLATSLKRTALAAGAAALLAPAAAGAAEKPFGTPDAVAYAETLWGAMEDARLVGPDSIQPFPYEGEEPHGAILQTMDVSLDVAGHEGMVLVKKNHRGENVGPKDVATEPRAHLKSITVMFQREAGYDPDHANWFWVKYAPDGSVLENPKGMKLAGRVAKGRNKGCIACHSTAPGDDYIFTNDRME